MRLTQSENTLTIDRTVSSASVFVSLAAGLIFLIIGVALLTSDGTQPIPILFTILGAFTLFSFLLRLASAQRTYIFDRQAQTLQINQQTIPFSDITDIRVGENQWSDSDGNPQTSYEVTVITGMQDSVSIPAKSQNEANEVVEILREYVNNPEG